MDRGGGWWYKLSQFWTNWQVTVVMEPGVAIIDSSDGGADDDEENNDRGQRFRRYLPI